MQVSFYVCKLKCISSVYKKNIRKKSNPILVQLILLIVIIRESTVKMSADFTPVFHFESSCVP